MTSASAASHESSPFPDQALDSNARALEQAVATVLRVGVLTSSLITIAGAVVTLVSSATRSAARTSVAQIRRGVLHPAGLNAPHTISSVFGGLGHREGPALVMLGALLLIATPVLRVAVSVIGFAIDHDRRFVLITLTVLVVLIGSFAVGT